MRFSIITATFDRCQVLGRSIESALSFARAVGETEVILVDDASRDGTVDMIRDRYARELATGLLILIERRLNGGVTAAKNEGARTAKGDWLLFLDSDDQLLPDASVSIPLFANEHALAPLLFFRCQDQTGELIGPPVAQGPLDLVTMLDKGTPGECLPVVARAAFREHPYDEDLRGFELLAYLRIARAGTPAMLSDAVVRRYETKAADRLSARAGRMLRAASMARGYARILREFGNVLQPRRRMALRLRVAYYRLAAVSGSAF